MDNELKALVEKAYKIFGSYKPDKKELWVCPCCVDKDTEKYLLETPLREIEFEPLVKYNQAVHCIPSNVNEFKYFLPRMLEFISYGDFPYHSKEIALARVGEERTVKHWPSAEAEILDEFVRGIVLNTCYYNKIEFEIILIFAANVGTILESIITELLRTRDGILIIANLLADVMGEQFKIRALWPNDPCWTPIELEELINWHGNAFWCQPTMQKVGFFEVFKRTDLIAQIENMILSSFEETEMKALFCLKYYCETIRKLD